MTLATVEIFPLQFFLRIILYFVFVLRFSVVLEAHSWCKRRGWNSLLEKKKGLFLVSQSVGFTLYGNVAAFNSCCCCLFNILLHDGLILCSGRARPCCRVFSRSQPSRYVNSISLIVYIAWLISFFTLKPWYSCAFSSGGEFCVNHVCDKVFFRFYPSCHRGGTKKELIFPRGL